MARESVPTLCLFICLFLKQVSQDRLRARPRSPPAGSRYLPHARLHLALHAALQALQLVLQEREVLQLGQRVLRRHAGSQGPGTRAGPGTETGPAATRPARRPTHLIVRHLPRAAPPTADWAAERHVTPHASPAAGPPGAILRRPRCRRHRGGVPRGPRRSAPVRAPEQRARGQLLVPLP